jgi:PPOX class probable F420-dependent enzyme
MGLLLAAHDSREMTFTDRQRQYITAARVARLATADTEGRPHVVPICFTLHDSDIVTPLDEKPKHVDQRDLRRVQDIHANDSVSLVVNHYRDNWATLGWVQVRGTAHLVGPGEAGHAGAIAALREKYDQYKRHQLEELPIIRIAVSHVVSWGTLFPDDA